MTGEQYKVVIEAIEKYAARFRKVYKDKDMIEQYGGSADWVELTACGIEAINENDTAMFDWCHAYRCAQKAIQAKRRKWHDHKYKEPVGLSDHKSEVRYGHEIKQGEYTDSNKIKPIVKRFCPVCGSEIYKTGRKTCSIKCRKSLERKLKNIII